MADDGPSTLRFWIGGVLGGLGAVAPISTLGEQVTIIDMAIGGALWFGIGVGIGTVVDSVRRKRSVRTGPQGLQGPQGAPTPPVSPGAAPMAPVTQDGWYVDPFGRFHYRYFQGGAWTDQVSANGRTYTDQPG